MTKLSSKLLLAVLPLALLGGCKDDTSPENVVKLAGKAIYDRELGKFQNTLTGDALAQYGNYAGMTHLRMLFPNDKDDVKVSDAFRVNAAPAIPGADVFVVQVAAKLEHRGGLRPVLEAQTDCVTSESYVTRPAPIECIGSNCWEIGPPSNQVVYETHCRISRITEL